MSTNRRREEMNATTNLHLPAAFLDFLNEHGVNPDMYTAAMSLPRYIRIKPGKESEISKFEAEIKCKFDKVAWLPWFYAIPSHVRIASSKAYLEGQIYGMDAASGAAVLSLEVSSGDHILDLCAAPGAKTCMISDLLGNSGSLTGVDVMRHRLSACRTMLQKYSLGDYCRLFLADGSSFSLLPPRVCPEALSVNVKRLDVFGELTSKRKQNKRRVSKAGNFSFSSLIPAFKEPELIFYGRHSGVVGLSKTELFHEATGNDALESGYDKVLVDAECTHDGSFKHIEKFEYWGWETLQCRVLNPNRIEALAKLQFQLLSNGFKLLRTGGLLVYSTCSLTVAQNEDVVEEFLSKNRSAELQEINAARSWPCRSGAIPKTIRFDPVTSCTSGLFIAKFKRLAI